MASDPKCTVCGFNCPYTDWKLCQLCTDVLHIAGKEKTSAEATNRARWERRMADVAMAGKFGAIIAQGHLRAAEAYETMARGSK